MKRVDISEFRESGNVLGGTRWLLVVKSQDQPERRREMLDCLARGKFGRVLHRPVSKGLLVTGRLEKGAFRVEWQKEFREPRCARKTGEGLLVAEADRVLRLEGAEVVQTFEHAFFAYLHTVDVRSDAKRMLVTSAGYDSVFENNLADGWETFRWCAWNHGFNPDDDGRWLAMDEDLFKSYRSEGKDAVLIRPDEHGALGLVTSRRTAHPNAAVYDPYDGERSFIVSIARNGHLCRVSLADGRTELVCDALGPMPHGLMPHEDGWAMTDTTRGEWRLMGRDFGGRACYSFARLPNEVGSEWVQKVVPRGETFLALDANRGLVAVDTADERYSIYRPDPNWCIQDALFCG